MTYLLDTNACVAVLNTRPAAVRDHYQAREGAGHTIVTSTIVTYELWYGVSKSKRKDKNAQVLSALLSQISVLPFTDDDGQAASVIRAELESSGQPIGPYDVLIAGQAVSREAVLVTANVREFSRVANLLWEDWACP